MSNRSDPEPPLRLPRRSEDAHKGDFGRALLIGGSRGMSGAIAMSAIAALRSGAGLVTAAVPNRCLETVAGFHPAVMTIPIADTDLGRFSIAGARELEQPVRDASAIGCGPGMSTDAGSIRIVERLLSVANTPRVLDADAINVMARHHLLTGNTDTGPVVLTPHPGELQRLTGVKSTDRMRQIEAAQQMAAQQELTIVVKGGPTTVVGSAGAWTNTTGNPGMATAGSGDVLTGVITALLAQGLVHWDAARLGVWVHGCAGDLASARIGQPGLTAVELIEALPAAIRLAIE